MDCGDEDYITRRILKLVRQYGRGLGVLGPIGRTHIRWIPWKLTIPAESDFGEIAVLVHISDKDGTELEGRCR